MNFASQCIYAGFWGSDDATSVDSSSFPQDASGTTATTRWIAKPKVTYWAWTAVSYFDDYIAAQSSQTDTRMTASQYEFSANTYTLTSTLNLLGSVVFVPSSNGNYGHAMVITKLTGSDRNQMFYSAHTSDVQNARLSDYYPSCKLKFTVPVKMIEVVSCTGSAHSYTTISNQQNGTDCSCNNCGHCKLYVKNDLQGCVSTGATVTLTGGTNVTCYRMAMKVQRVGSSTATWLGEVTNTNSYSASYKFTQAGLYIVTLYARDTNPDVYPNDTTSVSSTYVIRVG